MIRARSSGRFSYDGDMMRLCTCGHPLGVHSGEAPHACYNEDDGIPGATGDFCECERFKLSKRKNPETFDAIILLPSGAYGIPHVPARRSNPASKGTATGHIRWGELVRTEDGQRRWNPELRSLVSKSGVYALRVKATKSVLYVGESHTGRLYRTLLRHFEDPSGKFADRGEWTTSTPGKLQVAWWVTSAAQAPAWERTVIEALRPAVNSLGVQELEDAPF